MMKIVWWFDEILQKVSGRSQLTAYNNRKYVVSGGYSERDNLSIEVYKKLINVNIKHIDEVLDADKKILMNALP